MIWTDKTYDYSATLCQYTGKPCAALARLAGTLTQAIDRAVAAAGPEFEMEGSIAVNGCARDCTARFISSRTRTRLFCDIADDVPQVSLDRLADVMLGDAESPGFPALPTSHMPCSMLQADLRIVPSVPATSAMHP